MKKLLIVASIFVVFCLTGCAQRHNIINTFNATDANFMTMKKGTDCQTALFGIFPFNEMNIDQAAKKANISKVKYVEHHTSGFLFFTSFCVDVYGE